jgi:hypothetical protein
VSWLRIEGSTRDPELTEGLSARIADPLWTLARQWQVGEFHGEDAASPILVTAEVAFTPLTAFAPGDGSGGAGKLDRAEADRPLEVLVEQEPAGDDIRLALELGWILVRSLRQLALEPRALAALRERYRPRLPAADGLDPAGRAQLELLARRSLDGFRAAAELADARRRDAVLAAIGVAEPGRPRAARALEAWVEAVDGTVREPDVGSAWQDGPLEYRFRVAAPVRDAELGLEAAEYRGGTLDWFHFRRAPDADLGAGGQGGRREITVLPGPLRFHGMPAPRFWEIEDETVSFGDLAAAPEDLVRAIVGGFAAVYADDWMSVPCVLPVGSLARVTRLVVHDDYGRRHVIPAAAVRDGPDRVWRFFEIEGDDGPDAPELEDRVAPIVLLAPALPDTEEGPPLERVDLLRDQVANLAWAIERRAVVASGRSADRDSTAVGATDAEQAGGEWRYTAYTPVPENWIPLVPVRSGDGSSAQVHLRRGRMAVPPPGLPAERLLPRGRILDASRPLRIHEEAIPDAGIRVDRRYQRARGADGRVHLWIGRRVRTGAWPAAGRFTTDRLRRPGTIAE